MVERQLEIYDFTKNEFNIFNDVSGVYGILYNNTEVIYIGQSVNIRSRLDTHSHTKSNINNILRLIAKEDGRCNRTKSLALYQFMEEHIEDISFIVFKETLNRDKWEEHYISLFKPKFNYKGVDVPYRNEVA